MSAAEPVERPICNLRFHGWHGLLWIFGWGLVWIPAAAWADSGFPSDRYIRVIPVVVLALASYAVVIIALSRLPIRRLRLGDQLRAGPAGWIDPAGIAAIRFACDPDEDFDDSCVTRACCPVTVEHARGRPIQVVVTRADAADLCEWAKGKRIVVCDPDELAAEESLPVNGV